MTTTFEMQRAGTTCKVCIGGALTAIMVPELKEALQHLLEQDTQELVFDLRDTTMLDSSGIGLLIACNNTMSQKSGHIRVINPSKDIFKLLSNMRLVTRFKIPPVSE